MLEYVSSIEVDAQERLGETALHDSCERKDTKAVEILVKAGARCDIRNEDGRIALEVAELKENTKILEILKKAKDFDSKGGICTGGICIRKTLIEAVVADPVDVLQIRIANASIEESHNSSAFTGIPLHQSCEHGRADFVKMLLDAGSNTEIKNSFNRTPICMAIHFGRLECLKVLIDHGANMEASPYHDFSLWEYAYSLKFIDAAMVLIKRGAIINKASRYLGSLLLQAVYDENAVVARHLVEAGASRHQKVRGVTAMQLAYDGKSLKVLEYFGGLADMLNRSAQLRGDFELY